MAAKVVNPLITIKPSDSPLAVRLHPLVLITITDYISRHTLTQKQGPIVGAVLGQQNGREITLEHAFESHVKPKAQAGGQEAVLMDEPWFSSRVAQYKEVHASPPLDLTAIFTLGSTKGPAPDHVPLIQQVKANYNDDALLILFHPEMVLDGSLTGGKLPITIYEAFYEPGTEDGDKGLQIDGWGVGRQLQLKFRQISADVITGEAEMIGVDYVAKGAANAQVAVDPARKTSTAAPTSKGKGKEKATDQTDSEKDAVLSAQDEELIASLTSKANAIKMLHSRINLLKSYLQSLPPSYLTDNSIPPSSDNQIPHTILRQISALLSRLPLLAPPTITQLSQAEGSTLQSDTAPHQPAASNTEASDVALTTLLSSLTKTIADTRELTQKASIVNRARSDRRMASMARDGADADLGKYTRGARGPRGGGASSFGPDEGGFDSGLDGGEEF
ncbi:26S proteasome regulatory subunit rpn-8 [Sphaceloma murrayae]|uniref:COP9 signalosome complex subunit 6 n=1 Tax=Sphaceloma murrayae TaxID=2082308 RepID=A0A2K1QQR5_9PEZI|nr:26S proteasome regulatory subunit rpn-8 [Sphaceloma murrayae]